MEIINRTEADSSVLTENSTNPSEKPVLSAQKPAQDHLWKRQRVCLKQNGHMWCNAVDAELDAHVGVAGAERVNERKV